MFNNQRYVTRGITSTVPLVTQIILWDCIDSMKVERKDYLQVFNLVANGTNQQVTHSQEGSLDDSTESELITYLKERQLYINTPITTEEDD